MESTLCAEVVEAKTNSIAQSINIFFIVFVCWLSFFNLLSIFAVLARTIAKGCCRSAN